MKNSARLYHLLYLPLLFILLACGAEPTPEPTPAPPRQLEVVLFESFSPSADDALRNLVQRWGDANNVELTLLDTMPAGQAELLESGAFPDCGMSWELNAWITNDVLAETTEIIAELDGYAGGYLENALLPSRMEGKQWAIPFALVNSVFFVRQDKLGTAGLPLPTTWEDVVLMAEAITEPEEFWGWGMQIGTSGDTETAFRTKLWSYGGSVWDSEGRPALDSTATRQVLELMQATWLAGVVPPDAPEWTDSGNNEAYLAGRVGMVLNAGSLLNQLQEDSALLANTAVLPPPAGPSGRLSPGDVRHWVIFKTAQVDLCRDLTTWLFAPDHINDFYAAGTGYFLPVYQDLLDDPIWQEPNRQVLAGQAANTVVTGYPGPITPWAVDARADGVIGDMIRHVLLDGWSVEEAVVEATDALQGYYDEWHVVE